MPRQGLNKQIVVESAANLILDKGITNFSMRELADYLKIKTASLYNHIDSMNVLYEEIGFFATDKLVENLDKSIQDKHRQDAIISLSNAYRQFAKQHYEWYKIIMFLPLSNNLELAQYPKKIIEPIMKVLDYFNLNDNQKMHQQRVLRSIMHGFLSQEENGYLCHFNINVEDSYTIAISIFINGILEIENSNENKQ